MPHYLASTGEKHLVEAAPKDKLWVIGYSMSDPAIMSHKNFWGKNIQGQICMDIRWELRREG